MNISSRVRRIRPILVSAIPAAVAAILATTVLTIFTGPSTNPTGESGRGGGEIEIVGSPLPTPTGKPGGGIVIQHDSELLPGTDTRDLEVPYEAGRLRIMSESETASEPGLPTPPSAGDKVVESVVREVTTPDACEEATFYTKFSPPEGLRQTGYCEIQVVKWRSGATTELSYLATFEGTDPRLRASMSASRYFLPDDDSRVEIARPHGDAVTGRQTLLEIDGVPVVITQDVPDGKSYRLQFELNGSAYDIGSINVGISGLIDVVREVIATNGAGS